MAEAMKIHASEIEGLEDILTEIVHQEFDRRPPMEDMEELKRSPAGTMIRLEGQVHALTQITKSEFQNIDEHFKLIDRRFEDIDRRFEDVDKQFEKIDKRFDTVDKQFEKIDERFDAVEAHIVQTDKNVLSLQEMFKTLVVKIDEQEKRLSLFQKITYIFFGVFSTILVAILVIVITLLSK